MPSLRAVADTNVLVAAAISPYGSCGQLLTAALDDRWKLVVSPRLLNELETVLYREKFRHWITETEVRQFASQVEVLAEVVADPPPAQRRATRDPKDEFLVVLAQAADVAALISGDPHLTELLDLEPPVQTPAEFLKELERPDIAADENADG